jgi:hypothetical protein
MNLPPKAEHMAMNGYLSFTLDVNPYPDMVKKWINEILSDLGHKGKVYPNNKRDPRYFCYDIGVHIKADNLVAKYAHLAALADDIRRRLAPKIGSPHRLYIEYILKSTEMYKHENSTYTEDPSYNKETCTHED